MDCGGSESSSGGERSAGPSKTSALPTATRMQRNKAEKQRRDRLNGYISELATLVPMVSNASKPLDKVSILRLAAAQMRLNFSCLNPKKFKSEPVTLPPSVISYLDVIEKTIGGFILASTFSGCIIFCSKSIEDYVGYQNIDVMGNSVYSYIHNGDVSYFEKKVNSVISSQAKGSKKRNKVIKVHMQQRPLPRSNDVRYRKMIFKISVHLNDPESVKNHGQTTTSNKHKKNGRLKDFGASAVVLYFIEPVRLEPEIDISYIESHQDAYFTMHGLQGEIIYADQRISSITGYMPHDVQGTSAYQYISSSDVPIALFAQQAMFSSNDGTGIIVYRLRIRDMRFIYLQSSGQIAYKDSSNEISHFVCFNKLLSDEEGSQELKRFQQRFAPQIMAAKLRQGKLQNGQEDTAPPVTDLALEQAMKILKASVTPGAAPATQSFVSPKDSPVAGPSGISRKILSKEFAAPVCTPVAPSSAHSSNGHSLTHTIIENGSGSTSSGYSGLSTPFINTAAEVCVQPSKEPNPRSLLRNNCPTFASNTYDSGNRIAKEGTAGHEICEIDLTGMDHLVDNSKPHPQNVNCLNGSHKTRQNGSDNNARQRKKMMYSVNGGNSIQEGIAAKGTVKAIEDEPPLNFIFDRTFIQRDGNVDSALNSPLLATSNDFISKINDQCNDFVIYNDHAPYLQVAQDSHYVTTQNGLHLPVTISELPVNTVPDQPVDINMEQASQNMLLNDLSSFSGLLELSNSSLSNRLSVDSGLGDTVDYSSVSSLYPEVSSYSNHYIPRNGGYNNGAVGDAYPGPDMKPKSAILNHHEANAFLGLTPEPSSNITDRSTFDSTKLVVNDTPVNGDVTQLSHNANVKQSMIAYHSDRSDVYATNSEQIVNGIADSMEWNGTDIKLGPAENFEMSMNRELYTELELFFQNLPHQNSRITETDAVFAVPPADACRKTYH